MVSKIPTDTMMLLRPQGLASCFPSQRLGPPKGSDNQRPWCGVPPLSKDGQSSLGSLRGAITEVMTHNTSHTRFKHMKCYES
jgi:hypothetical protein